MEEQKRFRRVFISEDSAELAERTAGERGVLLEDLLEELIFEAFGEKPKPRTARKKASTSRPYISLRQSGLPDWYPEEFREALAEVTDERVVAVRLGGPDVSDAPAESTGVDIDEDDLTVVWRSAHGHWAINPATRYIAAFRLGKPMGLFYVEDWVKSGEDSRRRYASGGYAIDDMGELVDVRSGEVIGEASEVEKKLYTTIMSHGLVMKPGAQNPVTTINEGK